MGNWFGDGSTIYRVPTICVMALPVVIEGGWGGEGNQTSFCLCCLSPRSLLALSLAISFLFLGMFYHTHLTTFISPIQATPFLALVSHGLEKSPGRLFLGPELYVCKPCTTDSYLGCRSLTGFVRLWNRCLLFTGKVLIMDTMAKCFVVVF